MQKGVAAIKPAYSCSQGVPETGTGSGYPPWDGRRANSEWGAWKTPSYCGKVPFGPTGIAPPVTAGRDGLTQLMHSGKGSWWWQVGGGNEKLSSAKSGILSLH